MEASSRRRPRVAEEEEDGGRPAATSASSRDSRSRSRSPSRSRPSLTTRIDRSLTAWWQRRSVLTQWLLPVPVVCGLCVTWWLWMPLCILGGLAYPGRRALAAALALWVGHVLFLSTTGPLDGSLTDGLVFFGLATLDTALCAAGVTYLLRPTTPDTHWALQASHRIDRLWEASFRGSATTTTGRRRPRPASCGVAFLAALGVLAFAGMSLGLTNIMVLARHDRPHPCAAPFDLRGVPLELQAFLTDDYRHHESLPKVAASSQKGTLYQSPTRLYFTAALPRTPEQVWEDVRRGQGYGARDILFIQPRTTGVRRRQPPLVPFGNMVRPNFFTLVELPDHKAMLCFLASNSYLDDHGFFYCLTDDDNAVFDLKVHTKLKLPRYNPERQVFGFAESLWIRESPRTFSRLNPLTMEVVTYEHPANIADTMGRCFWVNPLFVVSLLAGPLLVLGLSYQVLWKRGIPSAGATVYWALHALFCLLTDCTSYDPPPWIITLEVVLLTAALLPLRGATTAFFVTPRVRAALSWTLYGGLFPLYLVAEPPLSSSCTVALVISALLLQHPLVLTLWFVVLILVTEESLRRDLGLSQGWSVLLSWVGVLGVAQVLHVHVLWIRLGHVEGLPFVRRRPAAMQGAATTLASEETTDGVVVAQAEEEEEGRRTTPSSLREEAESARDAEEGVTQPAAGEVELATLLPAHTRR